MRGVERLREHRREENDRAFGRGWSEAEEPARPFLCECGDPGCSDVIWLTPEEYGFVRDGPERFAVAPGHERDDADVVVEHTDRAVLVEHPPSELFLG
jgi:hypothetical protein